MAAAVATSAVGARLAAAKASERIEWRGGFAIRGPASLRVVLRKSNFDP
jgi:hypothetical protein